MASESLLRTLSAVELPELGSLNSLTTETAQYRGAQDLGRERVALHAWPLTAARQISEFYTPGGGREAEEGGAGGLDAKAADDPQRDDARLSSLGPCHRPTSRTQLPPKLKQLRHPGACVRIRGRRRTHPSFPRLAETPTLPRHTHILNWRFVIRSLLVTQRPRKVEYFQPRLISDNRDASRTGGRAAEGAPLLRA